MSVNRDTCLLYRDHAKASSGERALLVFEHDNMSNFDKSTHSTYYTDSVKDIMFCAHTYTRIECLIQYFDTRFEHCEVTITDRFTMDSTRFTLEYTNATHGSDSNPKYYNRQIKDYSIAQFAYDQIARTDADDRINGKKFTNVTLLLSMADFPHYGDIVFQFYGQNESTKDTYSDPVIVQFTNAPTIYQSNLYKWHPHNIENQNQYDPDNVFNSAFGEFWNSAANTRSAADSGRVNVLTADTADGYIDVYTTNRLMTNGIRDWNDPPMSLSGHPMYIAHYDSFVPKSFSDVFGINQRPVKFTTIPLQEELGSNCCAYLTTSGSTDIITNPDDAFNIRIKQVSPDESSNNMKLIVVSGADAGANSALTGYHQRFNAYIGCITGDADLSDGNGTLFKNRKPDAWYRTHTMLHANFALTGLDPYWTGESDELPILMTDRLYYVFNNASYTPNVFELSWFAAGAGTSYYLVKKCPTGQDRNTWINDTANWIQVFTKENRPEYLLSDKTICADNKTVMCKENDPVAGQASNGVKYITDPSQCIYDNIEDIELDNNGRPLVVHETYQTYGVLHGRRSFSDNSRLSYEAYPSFAYFRIISETSKNGLHAVVYRVSDNGNSDSNFELDDADAEFAVIYRA